MTLRFLFCAALAVVLCACGDGATDTSPDAKTAPAPDALAADALGITIEVTPPGPELGDNEVIITLQDADGAAVLGAVVTVSAFMPAHGHGSPRPAVVEELGEGRYRASPVVLHMPGTWTLTVQATQGERTGERVWTWAIAG